MHDRQHFIEVTTARTHGEGTTTVTEKWCACTCEQCARTDSKVTEHDGVTTHEFADSVCTCPDCPCPSKEE